MRKKPGTPDAQIAHPCRLFCRLARQTPVGLIIRRGPSSWVQLSLWHTDTDEIESGQWFHGGVPENRCDLSPDGSLFLFFATKYGRAQFNTWTAISRPPYFTALALWPLGDSWGGGGVFVDERTILLGHNPDATPALEGYLPPPWLNVRMFTGRWEHASLSHERLLRNGWIRRQKGVQSSDGWPFKLLEPEIFQKRHSDGRYLLLRKDFGSDFGRSGSPNIVEFSLQDTMQSQETVLDGATWADFDHRQRLVFTKNDGGLYADALQQGVFSPHSLVNLNDQRPRRVITPRWATTWEKRTSQR